MEEELYRATITNLPFKQAQALYRLLLNMDDVAQLHGNRGQSWSGLIPGRSPEHRTERSITIRPMPTHEQACRELGRYEQELAQVMQSAVARLREVIATTPTEARVCVTFDRIAEDMAVALRSCGYTVDSSTDEAIDPESGERYTEAEMVAELERREQEATLTQDEIAALSALLYLGDERVDPIWRNVLNSAKRKLEAMEDALSEPSPEPTDGFSIGQTVTVALECPGPGTREPRFLRRVSGVVTRRPAHNHGCLALRFVVDEDNYDDWYQLMPDQFASGDCHVGSEWVDYNVDPEWVVS